MIRRSILMLMTVVLLFLLAGAAWAAPITFSVGSESLWTDTEISVRPNDRVTIDYLSGGFTWADWHRGGQLFGPQGDFQPTLAFDEWITNGRHGQIIGFIGAEDPNAFPRTVRQNSPGLFVIGDGVDFLSRLNGSLWLGINDDFTHTEWVADYRGSALFSVDVAPVPEPSTMLLLGAGLISIGVFTRRFRR